MRKRTVCVYFVAIMLAVLGTAQANVLWDVERQDTVTSPATVQDFIDAGVSEDLTGVSVSLVVGAAGASMTDGTVTLSYVSGSADGTWRADKAVVFSNNLLLDYIYLNAAASTDIEMQISGLSAVLLPKTVYSFYLFGVGDDTAGTQNSTFTFNGAQQTVPVAPITDGPDNRYVKYSFTTGATVTDTLDFTWHPEGHFAALNGFAIVLNPPTSVLPPTTLVATAGPMKVDLVWDAGQNAASYTVHRTEDSSGSNLVAVASNLTALSHTDTAGLMANTPYYYAVTSESNGIESVYSSLAMAIPYAAGDTTSPDAPTVLSTFIANSVAVILDWDANAAPDLSHYNVYRSTEPAGPFTNAVGTTTSITYTDEAPADDEIFYYAVTASDFAGNESDVGPVATVDLGSRYIIEGEMWDAMSGVQTEATDDIGGGLNVGWTDSGDWTLYEVDLPAAGEYEISLRIARQPDGDGTIDVALGSNGVSLASVVVPNTGGWQNWETVSGAFVAPEAGAQILQLTYSGGMNINWLELTFLGADGPAITAIAVDGTELVLAWDAQEGAVYTLEEKSEMASMDDWADVPGFVGMTGTVDGTMSVTGVADQAKAYFRVDETPPPPLFFDDLESGAAGWTSLGTANTPWELGTPGFTRVDGMTTHAFTNAYSGANAWATGLATSYAYGASVTAPRLETPEIDLTDVSGAQLTFYHANDIERVGGYGDYGYVNILTNGTPMATNVFQVTGVSTAWRRASVDLSAFAGQRIVVEFELYEDGYEVPLIGYFGWAIDDIKVTKTAAPPPPPPPFTNSVVELVLVDSSGAGNPPADLATITEGLTLDLDTLGVAYSNVNVRAEVDGAVGSVTFALTGATAHNQAESVGPYYLFGDVSGDANDGALNIGAHTLVATPWESGGGTGGAGTNLTVNFSVTYAP